MGERRINPVNNIFNKYREMNLVNPYILGKNLTENLIAYYKLDGNGIDSTNLSPNAIASDITYTAGKTGQAAVFDSGLDRLTIADTNNLSFTDGTNDIPFSISLWVYFISFNSTGNWFINKRDTTPAINISEWQLALINGSGLVLSKYISSSAANQSIRTLSNNPFSLNTWYLVTATDDGSKTNAGMKIYINSVIQTVTNANTGTYTGMTNTDKITSIGTLSQTGAINTATTHFGYMEDIAIWKNRILAQEDINYLYNGGNGRDIM